MKKLLLVLALLGMMHSASGLSREFETLEGETLSYEKLVAFPQTVLFIWTTWCSHCQRELERLAEKCVFFDNINVFYVNSAEKKSLVAEYAQDKDLRSCVRQKIILDYDSFLAKKFSVLAVPTFIFLKDGKIVHKAYYLDEELVKTVFADN